MKNKTLIVIGGGAAGFFCAVNAARLHPGLRVILLEKSAKLLSKVKVSGGGRCNVTHACFDIVDMSRNYPRGSLFVKKTFHQFFTTDTIEWFRARGVELKREQDGRMFPVTDSSQTIIDCLLNEASMYGVDIRMHSDVKGFVRKENGFEVQLANGELMNCDSLCIACGGFNKTSMFDWIVRSGHTIEPPVPSLFTFNMPGHALNTLMGVSVPHARIKIAGTKLEQEGPVLITHWGLSGPAVLKLSALAARELAAVNYHFGIIVNWMPSTHEQALATDLQALRASHPQQKIISRNHIGMPQRLWEYMVAAAAIDPSKKWVDLSNREANALSRMICNATYEVKGKTTFKEEFVTAGGIRLSEIDPQTMMSKIVPSLFFAGEILDVDGVTGGFNFQHAWTSGFIVAAVVN